MIEVQNISKSFDDKNILDNISSKFKQGIPNLIIGASGTGKSVLLKCMVGLHEPDEGSVFYHDRDFTHADRAGRTQIRREIGMLFQGSALFDSKNVQDNVMFPLNVLTDMPADEKIDRANFCLNRVGLENTNKLMPSELSGGMKKRVGIARAIVNNSKYLYCDEPNSGLDPQTAVRIDDLILEITVEYDITTVVVTHDMNSVFGIGENIMFLFKGHKLWEGTKQEITDSGIPELDDFIFANKVMAGLRKK